MPHDDVGNLSDLSKRRLEVAREDLDTAVSNLKEGHLRAANNRAYYSIYHAITAVLALDNVAFKRHKDTISNFNKEYVKTEIFSRDLGKRIGKAEEVRHNSDYDDFYIVTQKETEVQIETAKLLINAVDLFLKERITMIDHTSL